MTRHLQDFYPSPRAHVVACLSLLPCSIDYARVIDPGAGDGAWGTAVRELAPSAYIVGYELRNVAPPVAYSEWHTADYLNVPIDRAPDVVVGNPPYSMALAFVRRSLHVVRHGGYVVFLLRLGFLASQDRYHRLWSTTPPLTVGVFAERPSFTGGGNDNSEYAAFVWQRGFVGDTTLRFVTTKAMVDAGQEEMAL